MWLVLVGRMDHFPAHLMQHSFGANGGIDCALLVPDGGVFLGHAGAVEARVDLRGKRVGGWVGGDGMGGWVSGWALRGKKGGKIGG